MALDKLSDYKKSTGKKYKSDYYTILNWVIKEVTGKDRNTVKAEIKLKKEQEEKQGKYHEDIDKGKLEKRLTESETREFIQSIARNKGSSNPGISPSP